MTGQTVLVSRNAFGAIENDGSGSPEIADDGRYVAFLSSATNLTNDQTNDIGQLYVRAFPQPTITAATPSSVARGTTIAVTVAGADFRATPVVDVPGGGVTVNSVTFVTETELSVSLTVALDASPGGRAVLVTNRGTGPGTTAGTTGACVGCLAIE